MPAAFFVTGATGFVGGQLVRTLVEAGHRVRALVRRPATLPAGVEPVRGNLENVRDFAEALAGVSAVVHAAALLDPIDDRAAGDRINRQATTDLALAAAARRADAFVFVSTAAAIGFRSERELLRPDAPCSPTTVYGRTKRAAEEALLNLAPGPMRVVIVRAPTVYGPGERRNFLELVRAVDTGLFLVPGAGDNRMSFCHVENLAQALAIVAMDARARGILHTADARPVTLREAVETIARALGRRILPLPFPRPLAWLAALAIEAATRPFGVRAPLSRARLRTLTSDFALDATSTFALGYRPRVDFTDGIYRTIAWYRGEGLLRSRRASP